MSEIDQEALALHERALQESAGHGSLALSDQAKSVIRAAVLDYARSLVGEARNLASRVRADVISANHVEQANANLVATPSKRWVRHIGMAGGLLSGTGLANAATMVTTSQYSTDGVLLSVSLVAVGVFAIAYHIGKE